MKAKELKKAIVTTTNSLNRILSNRNPPPYELASKKRKKIKKLSQELKEELEQQIKQAKIRLKEAQEFQKYCENRIILANPPPSSQIRVEEENLKELNKELKELKELKNATQV